MRCYSHLTIINFKPWEGIMKLNLFFACLCIVTGSAYASDQNEMKQNDPEPTMPRILELIPKGWCKFPAIEPSMPQNYIATGLKENFDMASKILWGEKKDIENLSEDIDSPVTYPVFFLRHAGDITQVDSKTFSCEKTLEQELKTLGAVDLKIQKLFWGTYPILACEYKKPDNSTVRFAMVGLNEDGWVILVNLHPQKPNKDISEDQLHQIWNSFLINTRQLEEQEYFIAKGMDMREGYTNFRAGTARLKVYVEKRKSDGKLAVLINPENPGITFEINELFECHMGSKWKFYEPCTKVCGMVTEVNKNMTNYIDTVITVLTKMVDEFSFVLDKTKLSENMIIFVTDEEKGDRAECDMD